MKKYVAGPQDKKSSAGFWGRDMDSHGLAAQRQFLEQLEMSIAVANREVIHQHVPNLNRETFQQLAVMVAKFRAAFEALERAIERGYVDIGK